MARTLMARTVMALDPIVLFFLFGLAAGLARADLRLPTAIYEFISLLLLLAIGLKGGRELAEQPVGTLLPQMAAVVGLGVATALVAFALLRLSRRLPRPDAASIAAHYGSVSVGTFAVALAYVTRLSIPTEPYVAVFVVLLEVPAIIVGVMLARGAGRGVAWGALAHEVLLGKGVVLLLGGLVIGWIAGPAGLDPLAPLFFDSFKGILALFLLEMGLVAAARLGGLRAHGLFLTAFALVMPLIGATMGGLVAWAVALSPGGALMLATLGASASYIAAPAAMRISVPEANPALSLTASLAVTFPFNILVGIPLYHRALELLYPGGG